MIDKPAKPRGWRRFCYGPDSLPFAFRNGSGDLVGFNVEMAHLLARDLGVTLEFVRVESDEAPGALEDGEELYDRWILGKEAKRGKPRWCICRDVLRWMD
jgi:hypothetical protein